jgi:hypothetical protein
MTTTIPSVNHILPDANFVEGGVSELPRFLQSKPNYATLVRWYCKRWDTMDKEVLKLGYLRLLDNASGLILDTIGEKFGLYRNSQSDLEYKALIKLRSFRQTKGDNRSDIVELLKILFFGENPLITKGYNNFIEVVIPANCLSDEDVAKQLEDMFPINTNLWVTQTDSTAFYLIDSKDGIQPEATGGLSDSKENSVESLLTNWIHSSARPIKNTG